MGTIGAPLPQELQGIKYGMVMVEMDETADGSVHAIVAKQFSIYEVIFLMIDLGYFLDAKCDNKKTSLWRPGYTCWSPSSSEGCGGRDQSLCGGCVLRGCNHAVHSRKSVSFIL